MASKSKVRSSPIKSVTDVRPGDIIFTPNDPTQLLLVARIYESKSNDKILMHFVCVSSHTSKVYDMAESLLWLLSMRKIKL
jgi:hypothetical protein